MKGQILKFPKITPKLCLNGRLYGPNLVFFFLTFQNSGKKTISRGDLGQHRPENFSRRCLIRRGAISCSPHTSFDKMNDSVVNSERGELVGGSDPPFLCKALTLRPVICGGRRSGFCYKHVWRLVCRKTETRTPYRLPTGEKQNFESM